MRIYVISDNKDKEIALANAIAKANHSPIMSELSSDDYNEMIDEAIDNAKSGYDIMVMLSADSVDACIEANKTGKLRAIVCSTAEDAAKARRAGVNLVVIDSSSTRADIGNVARGILSPATASAQPAQKRELVEKPAPKPMFGGVMKKKEQRPKEEPEEEEEEEEEPAPPKGGGIIGKIKYTFGLE